MLAKFFVACCETKRKRKFERAHQRAVLATGQRRLLTYGSRSVAWPLLLGIRIATQQVP